MTVNQTAPATAGLPAIDIVIVTWNSSRWIGPCLDALARTDYAGPWAVAVVDNGSADDSVAVARAHPLAPRVIALSENAGFGGACNRGWRDGKAGVVVFLNPDTEPRPDWLTHLARTFMAFPRAGVVGAKLLYPGGDILQHAGGVVYDNAMADHLGAGRPDDGTFDLRREVDYVTGAAMAVRRAVLETIGGFDPWFHPAYFEETDLCCEARARRWQVLYEPAAVVIHHESVSLEKRSPRFLKAYMEGRMRFLLKRFSAADWLTGYLPFEWMWLHSAFVRGARRAVWRSLLFALFHPSPRPGPWSPPVEKDPTR